MQGELLPSMKTRMNDEQELHLQRHVFHFIFIYAKLIFLYFNSNQNLNSYAFKVNNLQFVQKHDFMKIISKLFNNLIFIKN